MISARIIADSKSEYDGTRLTTFEVTFNRYVLAEANTHCMLSKNSNSSRAIPVQANLDSINSNPAIPPSFGKNQSGMVADNDVDEETAKKALEIWLQAKDDAVKHATALMNLGIHKQITNRIVEPFAWQKVLITGTEWDNFFWLRCHKDADPAIMNPAKLMLDAYNMSIPEKLYVGEWHTPFVNHIRGDDGVLQYIDANYYELTLEEALKVSASCCAQISYRKSDDSLEKANKVFDMLNLDDESGDTRKHASPVCHSGTPIIYPTIGSNWNNILGITHQDKVGKLWSANFKSFVQYRHTFPNESCKNHPDIIKK